MVSSAGRHCRPDPVCEVYSRTRQKKNGGSWTAVAARPGAQQIRPSRRRTVRSFCRLRDRQASNVPQEIGCAGRERRRPVRWTCGLRRKVCGASATLSDTIHNEQIKLLATALKLPWHSSWAASSRRWRSRESPDVKLQAPHVAKQRAEVCPVDHHSWRCGRRHDEPLEPIQVRRWRAIHCDGCTIVCFPKLLAFHAAIEHHTRRANVQPTGPIAVLSTPNAAPVTLQAAPGPAPRGAGPGALPKTGAASRLSLDALENDDRGETRFAGTAPAGSSVRVYSDHQPIGDAIAGPDGRWMLKPQVPIAPGTHDLRIDQLTAHGQVAMRVHMPFRREQLAARDIAEGRIAVQPGQSLWRLARRAYGSGVRYTVIYQANRDQIRDPDLIYPGQTFAVPEEVGGDAASGVAPAASSISR